jgi:hypothetical protein
MIRSLRSLMEECLLSFASQRGASMSVSGVFRYPPAPPMPGFRTSRNFFRDVSGTSFGRPAV